MPTSNAAFINKDASMGSGYPVTLPTYDGPLDLLLQLIERNELDISQVSLCAVTDQYLKRLAELTDIEPVALADFLTVASRLLVIKSNRILPKPAFVDEEEEDAGESLIRQLLEYRRFRAVADDLQTRSNNGFRAHVRPVTKAARDIHHVIAPDLSNVIVDDLQAALRRVLQEMPVEPPPPRVIMHRYTVADQIERVRDFVRRARNQRNGGPVLFSAVLGSAYTRTEAIVTFLAILELIKLHELTVEQEGTFGEIVLIPIEAETESPPSQPISD